MAVEKSRSPDDFARLVRYTHWANARVLEALRMPAFPPDRAVELFNHLLRAQDVWYGRMAGTEHADLDLWTDEGLPACADRLAESTRRWQAVIDEHDAKDLNRSIAYKNSEGIRYETPLRDILNHVVNHGTHHRAQIAFVLRENGIAPPTTGYIYFLREE